MIQTPWVNAFCIYTTIEEAKKIETYKFMNMEDCMTVS